MATTSLADLLTMTEKFSSEKLAFFICILMKVSEEFYVTKSKKLTEITNKAYAAKVKRINKSKYRYLMFIRIGLS